MVVPITCVRAVGTRWRQTTSSDSKITWAESARTAIYLHTIMTRCKATKELTVKPNTMLPFRLGRTDSSVLTGPTSAPPVVQQSSHATYIALHRGAIEPRYII